MSTYLYGFGQKIKMTSGDADVWKLVIFRCLVDLKVPKPHQKISPKVKSIILSIWRANKNKNYVVVKKFKKARDRINLAGR